MGGGVLFRCKTCILKNSHEEVERKEKGRRRYEKVKVRET